MQAHLESTPCVTVAPISVEQGEWPAGARVIRVGICPAVTAYGHSFPEEWLVVPEAKHAAGHDRDRDEVAVVARFLEASS